MKKHSSLSLSIDKVVIDGHTSVNIHISKSNLRDWCLLLQLLYDNLIESFSVQWSGSPAKVKFTIGAENQCNLTIEPNFLKIAICITSIDYIRHFFLRYFRDGVAEVDHIDIETKSGGYITFHAMEYMPPLSAEEAKRRLGM